MERAPIAESREFVLCFDGTGYKFRGDEADSNVLKIYRVSGEKRGPVPSVYPNTNGRC